MKISALILTRNEENSIGDCLKQLDFVDEIIILDQQSNDKTINIAKKYTNNIYTTGAKEFDKNRNTLMKKAQNPWLLYVDSDERYSHDLIEEIKKSTKKSRISVFFIPRKNIILGKWMKHGGFWPDYVPKLFKKESLRGWSGAVHESPIFEGKSKKLINPIRHLTALSTYSMLNKTIKWAEIEANLAYSANHSPVNGFKVIKSFIFEFLYRYFLKLGIFDGVVGLIQSIFQSYHKSITLIYLWEFQTKSKEKIFEINNE